MVEDNMKIAEIYMTALRTGRKPVEAVVIEMGISKRDALRGISLARSHGWLKDRQDDGKSLRNLLAAEALGVRYEDLVSVIREYGDGRLEA